MARKLIKLFEEDEFENVPLTDTEEGLGEEEAGYTLPEALPGTPQELFDFIKNALPEIMNQLDAAEEQSSEEVTQEEDGDTIESELSAIEEK
jgi:hypothetical protein